MKMLWKELTLAILMGIVMPGVLLGVATSREPPRLETSISTDTILETLAEAQTEPTTPTVVVPILTDRGVVEMDLDEYLTGVVLGEMPVSFELEALKAQGVVARTYTMRAWYRGGRHDGAAVCTDSTCCQSYRSPENHLAAGGTWTDVERIRGAVRATTGQVLTYEGQLIEATYFSCSGGTTEDAVAVWGTDYPYLRSVDSPGEEGATHYTDTVTFTPAQFEKAMGVDLTGSPSRWFGLTTYTTGGGVSTMEIGGTAYKGTTLRSKLGLRSTVFTVSATDSTITIKTKGFGHRVGMSQYGADAMAVLGSSYREILSHYYQGTTLTLLEN